MLMCIKKRLYFMASMQHNIVSNFVSRDSMLSSEFIVNKFKQLETKLSELFSVKGRLQAYFVNINEDMITSVTNEGYECTDLGILSEEDCMNREGMFIE